METQHPIQGLYYNSNGEVIDLMTGQVLTSWVAQDNMRPFYGVFIGQDGLEHDISEIQGGSGAAPMWAYISTFPNTDVGDMNDVDIADINPQIPVIGVGNMLNDLSGNYAIVQNISGGIVRSRIIKTDIQAHNTDANAHQNITSRINDAITTHNSATQAHNDIRTLVSDENTRAVGVEGTLSNLTTADKTNLVSAINEVASTQTSSPQACTTTYTISTTIGTNNQIGRSSITGTPSVNSIINDSAGTVAIVTQVSSSNVIARTATVSGSGTPEPFPILTTTSIFTTTINGNTNIPLTSISGGTPQVNMLISDSNGTVGVIADVITTSAKVRTITSVGDSTEIVYELINSSTEASPYVMTSSSRIPRYISLEENQQLGTSGRYVDCLGVSNATIFVHVAIQNPWFKFRNGEFYVDSDYCDRDLTFSTDTNGNLIRFSGIRFKGNNNSLLAVSGTGIPQGYVSVIFNDRRPYPCYILKSIEEMRSLCDKPPVVEMPTTLDFTQQVNRQERGYIIRDISNSTFNMYAEYNTLEDTRIVECINLTNCKVIFNESLSSLLRITNCVGCEFIFEEDACCVAPTGNRFNVEMISCNDCTLNPVGDYFWGANISNVLSLNSCGSIYLAQSDKWLGLTQYDLILQNAQKTIIYDLNANDHMSLILQNEARYKIQKASDRCFSQGISVKYNASGNIVLDTALEFSNLLYKRFYLVGVYTDPQIKYILSSCSISYNATSKLYYVNTNGFSTHGADVLEVYLMMTNADYSNVDNVPESAIAGYLNAPNTVVHPCICELPSSMYTSSIQMDMIYDDCEIGNTITLPRLAIPEIKKAHTLGKSTTIYDSNGITYSIENLSSTQVTLKVIHISDGALTLKSSGSSLDSPLLLSYYGGNQELFHFEFDTTGNLLSVIFENPYAITLSGVVGNSTEKMQIFDAVESTTSVMRVPTLGGEGGKFKINITLIGSNLAKTDVEVTYAKTASGEIILCESR